MRIRRPLTPEEKARDLARLLAWQAANKEKHKSAVARWRASHKDRDAGVNARFDINHPGVRLARVREYQAKIGPDRLREQRRKSKTKNIDRVRSSARAYYHSGKGKAIFRMREAVKRGSPTAGRVYVADVAAEQCGICYLCSTPMGRDISLDHIIPIVRGGEHSYANAAACHRSCNSVKGKRSLLVAMIAMRKTG